jgi:hypothetical protein
MSAAERRADKTPGGLVVSANDLNRISEAIGFLKRTDFVIGRGGCWPLSIRISTEWPLLILRVVPFVGPPGGA